MPAKLKDLESRLASLEREVRELRTKLGEQSSVPWYRQIVGAFKDDPVFDEIVRLGAAYREADRRKTRRRAR
jgi:hypothetical protein